MDDVISSLNKDLINWITKMIYFIWEVQFLGGLTKNVKDRTNPKGYLNTKNRDNKSLVFSKNKSFSYTILNSNKALIKL